MVGRVFVNRFHEKLSAISLKDKNYITTVYSLFKAISYTDTNVSLLQISTKKSVFSQIILDVVSLDS